MHKKCAVVEKKSSCPGTSFKLVDVYNRMHSFMSHTGTGTVAYDLREPLIKFVLPDSVPDFHVDLPDRSPVERKMTRHWE